MGPVSSAKTTEVLHQGHVGLEAWKNLLRSHSQLIQELDEQLRERHNFCLGDYDVLVNLANAPGQRRRMCALADAVLLSPSGLSRRVDRLEHAGFVRRERATNDARNIEAGLTPAGTRLLRRLRDTHLASVKERFVDRFSDDELDSLRDLLGRLTANEPIADQRC